jgi:hypothetical protein
LVPVIVALYIAEQSCMIYLSIHLCYLQVYKIVCKVISIGRLSARVRRILS